jgi:hypothetical protein
MLQCTTLLCHVADHQAGGLAVKGASMHLQVQHSWVTLGKCWALLLLVCSLHSWTIHLSGHASGIIDVSLCGVALH